ncbi:MAG TPA: hypothetical protein VLQ48_11770 [Chloroflexia bacterium]|nr:hypothetical protein [Chloroflexia bacterium]
MSTVLPPVVGGGADLFALLAATVGTTVGLIEATVGFQGDAINTYNSTATTTTPTAMPTHIRGDMAGGGGG